MMKLAELNISAILIKPDQPRKQCEERSLRELADSLLADGLQEPILVRPMGNKYEIVQGERRFKAHQMAGLATIQVKIKNLTDEEAFHLAVIENLQREQLTAIEEAEAFGKYVELGYTHEEIAKKVSKSRDYITSRLRLLKLIPEIHKWIALGKISEGHAKQILKLEAIAARLCGKHFFMTGKQTPFEYFQNQFSNKFADEGKITVDSVSDWVDCVKEFLLVAIVARYNGHGHVILSSTPDFDITARGFCDMYDLQIQNVMKEDIDFILERTLAKAEKERAFSKGCKKWEVFRTNEELKQRLFKEEKPDWTEEEKEFVRSKGWEYINELFIFHNESEECVM